MIWVAMVLIAAALTAVLVYLFVIRFRGMAKLGRLSVPCDEVIELPAGRHTVYYEDSFRWRFSDIPRPWDGFSLLISDEQSGGRIDLEKAPDETAIKTSGRNRIPYATVNLPHDGSYRVRAQVNADATEPFVTFG